MYFNIFHLSEILNLLIALQRFYLLYSLLRIFFYYTSQLEERALAYIYGLPYIF